MTNAGLTSQGTGGWRRAAGEPSLVDVFRSIHVSRSGSPWKRALAFIGPAI